MITLPSTNLFVYGFLFQFPPVASVCMHNPVRYRTESRNRYLPYQYRLYQLA